MNVSIVKTIMGVLIGVIFLAVVLMPIVDSMCEPKVSTADGDDISTLTTTITFDDDFNGAKLTGSTTSVTATVGTATLSYDKDDKVWTLPDGETETSGATVTVSVADGKLVVDGKIVGDSTATSITLSATTGVTAKEVKTTISQIDPMYSALLKVVIILLFVLIVWMVAKQFTNGQ